MNKGDLIIPRAMTDGIKDYETEKVAKFIDTTTRAMVEQFRIKDSEYDGSWQTDGLLSVHFNFKRKVDRLMAQFNNGIVSARKGENLGDTLVDLATYTLMYAYFMKTKDPSVEEFFKEFENKFLGISKIKGDEE